MLNPLKFLRYLVFVVFVICNAIITSAAVWNLSIVQVVAEDVVAKEISSYLIFLGSSGLLVIFPVLFFDLYEKNIFLSRVWFELLWVGLFSIMELAGAVAITAQSNGQTCSLNTPKFLNQISPCASTQVLQAFTWICAILLTSYFILLLVSATVKYRDDPTVWHCSVRKFPWVNSHYVRKNVPASSTSPLPRFRTQAPIIVAPRPQRIVANPEAILSYRSGLGLEYDIEHFQPSALAADDLGPFADRPLSPLALTLPVSPTRIPLQAQQARQKPESTVSTPFYPAHIQTAIDPGPQRPSIAHLSQVRRLPPAPSPPPLGDWPRRDATSQPARVKRKTVTRGPPPTSVPYSFAMPTVQPLPTARSRPSGPRRRSNSGENHRPPNLDLTNPMYD